jgi:hypothetical protein
MRKIEVMLYEFRELNDAAKNRAIERFREINVDYEWWSCSYDGMAECGIVIREFDTYRGTIESNIDDKYETAKTVISDWSETTVLHVLSEQFLLDRDALVSKYGEGNPIDGYAVKEEYLNEYDSDLDDLESEYHHDLNEAMLQWLREEYEYLTSDEAVIESIEINNYEFTEDGTYR